jgi:hypothetical protein
VKVLFLDIDGVLNSWEWYARRGKHARDEGAAALVPPDLLAKWGVPVVRAYHELDPDTVALLQTVIDATDCRIVISSTWRIVYDERLLLDVLRARGFRGEIIGQTPDLSKNEKGPLWRAEPRGAEIVAWLDLYAAWNGEPAVDAYAVVDDMSVQGMPGVEHVFVRTREAVGLTDKDVAQLIDLLGRKP